MLSAPAGKHTIWELSRSTFGPRLLDPQSVVELRRTVTLEAALFFSLPCWILTVDPAWPSGNPWQFVLTILIGASSAVVLCHLIPAVCEPSIELLWNTRAGRVFLFLLGAWFSLGAAAALFEMATLTGSMLVLWQDVPIGDVHQAWRWLARAIAVVCVVASMVCAAIQRWSARFVTVCLGVGVGLAVAGCVMQYRGLNSTNPRMQSEDGLSDAQSRVAKGMLLASAPAAVLAVRIGRMRLSLRRIVLTGFWGVWLPLIISVTLVSVAKMCGVRLYWKPSVPLDCSWAFVWLYRATDQTAALLWPLAATLAPPLLVLAVWITDMVRNWAWSWRKIVALVAVGVGGYHLHSPVLWDSASRSWWLWSIILASSALGALQLLIWMRPSVATRPSVSPRR